MGRLLILLLIVALVVWFVRRGTRRAEPQREAPAARTSEELVRCVQCGVLLPRAEARMAAGAIYCSDEHVRLGPAAGPNAGRRPH
ncbi:MAG TPA: PP0621 family protein [Burkholderiales bacterium]|nr:PP0621 family protein [Burkholderiales bacterium]